MRLKQIPLFIWLSAFAGLNLGYALTSTNFQLNKDSFASGGERAASINYRVWPASIGSPFGGKTSSVNYAVSEGISSSQVPSGSRLIDVSGSINDSTASVFVNNKPADVSGNTFIARQIPINEGQNTITVVASDQAGNTNTKAITVYYDSIPPAMPTLNPFTTPTANPAITLSGSKEANCSVLLLGKEIVPANPSLTWAYTYSLSEGSNTIWISSKDKAGNESSSVFVFAHLDALPPVITLAWPYNGFSTPYPVVNITGCLDDTAIVKINNSPALLNGLNFNAFVPLNLGANTITIEATSVTGKSSLKTITVTRGASPIISFITPGDKSRLYAGGIVTITVASYNPGSAVSYQFSVDGVVKQAWSLKSTFNWNIPATEFGRKKIKIQAKQSGTAEDVRQLEYFVYLKPVPKN